MTTKTMTAVDSPAQPAPTLRLNFLSHGTLEAKDLEFTRRFYEEFMGFECIQTSKISLWFRLGGPHVYVAVQSKQRSEMPMLLAGARGPQNLH